MQNWDLTDGLPFRLLDIDINQKTRDKDINDDKTNYTNEKSDEERRHTFFSKDQNSLKTSEAQRP